MDVTSTGVLTINPSHIGTLVVHYSYDALGRVIRVQRPHDVAGNTLDISDLYYDGVRVVQEVGWKDVPARAEIIGETTYYLPRRANEMHWEAEGGGGGGGGGGSSSQTCGPTEPSGWSWSDRRLEREYVWAADPAGYVDECVAQLVYTDAHAFNGSGVEIGDDTTATVLYVLSDHNANVIGLTDHAGRLVAQYGYTPYGELRSAEYFDPSGWGGSLTSTHAALGNRLGHQGLRTERFDRPWDYPMPLSPLDVGASGSPTAGTGAYRAVFHNRNRMYDPAEGRFMSRDPNGLGVPVLDATLRKGMRVTAVEIAPDLLSHYGDGQSTHEAYKSNPRNQRDALGLFLGMAYDAAGSVVQGMYQELGSQYAQNLSWDVDWATNWDLPDDAYTRLDSGWVDDALTLGAIKGILDFVDLELPAEFEDAWDQFTSTNASMARGGGSTRAAKARRAATRAISAGPTKVLNIDGHEIKTFKARINGRNTRLVQFPNGCVYKEVRIHPTGSRRGDYDAADAKAGWSESNPKPANHDWHHDIKRGVMQLIPKSVHRHPDVHHTGGWAIWGKP